jgi:hypothetical protein
MSRQPKLLFKYYLEGARALHGLLSRVRQNQSPYEPSDFGKAMDLLEADLLAGVQKRFEEYGPKASPAVLKQFQRMILEANFKK